MRIAVFGLGYVGSVNIACLAELGHSVIGVDVRDDKVDAVNAGRSPVKEPGLDSMIARLVKEGRIQATASAAEAVGRSDEAILCVGTPSGPTGELDSSQVSRVVREIAASLHDSARESYRVLNRSTCLPDVHRDIQRVLQDMDWCDVKYVVHPEFLREGSAVADFMDPSLIVFGGDVETTATLARDLYPGLRGKVFRTQTEEAALVKYACNMFHAAKVTFANEIGLLSRSHNVDSRTVMEILCQDQVLNISSRYLQPGLPFGGSCLPKDMKAMLRYCETAGASMTMASSILASNEVQLNELLERLSTGDYSRITLIGIAFKKDTDDLRNSPLVDLAAGLIAADIEVAVWDPEVELAELSGDNRKYLYDRIRAPDQVLQSDLHKAVADADAIVIGQRVDKEMWESLTLSPRQAVVDLVGWLDPSSVPGPYQGLYW